MNNILIRCDSSYQIGSGHVIRCMSLAHELKKKKAKVYFICRELPGNIIRVIEKDFEVIKLEGINETKESKIEALINTSITKEKRINQIEDANETMDKLEITNKRNVDILIIDHYELDIKWEKKMIDLLRLRSNYETRCVVIDDLENRQHIADVLIDQGYMNTSTRQGYEGLVPNNCKLLLGPQYAILAKEYKHLHNKIRRSLNRLNSIIIFFGGVDPDNITYLTAKALSKPEFSDINISIIVGRKYKYTTKLNELVQNIQNIKLIKPLSSMAYVIAKSDLGIGACGTTTWERACLGLPSITIAIAENQVQIGSNLGKANYHEYLGSTSFVTEKMISDSVRRIRESGSNFTDGRYLTDGKGAERISMTISESKIKLKLRHAVNNDKYILYRWVNEFNSRKNSIRSHKISLEEHEQWFKSVMRSDDTIIFIAVSDDNVEIGQVRFDKINVDRVLVDISIDCSARGKGIGSLMLEKAESKLKEFWNERITFIANIRRCNSQSIRLFKRSRYEQDIEKSTKNILEFSKTIMLE